MSPEHIKLWKAIDKILWEDWDPIGINDNHEARNEYYGYALQIFKLKIEGANSETIANRLNKYVTMDIGLNPDTEHCIKIAKIIFNLDIN